MKKNKKKTVKKEEIIPVQPKHRHLKGMFEDYFIDYSSYVILERAVPYLDDGLKPVQRRILHSMYEMEDGRYNKVANIIGNTMKYHPHGDASITDALVQLGQRDLLIDTQGNWGNIFTGDSAAASRYIEARLSKFALEVVFSPKITQWQLSYDGRNKEPVQLPVKFPLLLASGIEGIAVGLACKILPHNFCELIEASIDVLRKKSINLLPDFATGGIADFSKYNEGLRGGKIRVRAVIEKKDNKWLIIKQIPFGTTTTSLIESILAAGEKGKIKIKKVEDNTAAQVEIAIQLHPDAAQDMDKAIEALYAFTDCEVTISPNACVIEDGHPQFLNVNEILRRSTQNTVHLLKMELEIKRAELMEDWHFSSLEKIFIEKRIYRRIEECETWEAVLEEIDKGLKPYKKLFRREITQEDIVNLTEIKIKRISKFDSFKADEYIKSLEDQIKEINDNLKNLTQFAIAYFKDLLKKYGKGKERKTKPDSFEAIVAQRVVADNVKLYVNREEGFAGFGMKKDEYVCDCSDLDDVLAFTRDGKCMVKRIEEKTYLGKDILHIELFDKDQREKVYNMIYQDGKNGNVMIKRFRIEGVVRDKPYNLTKGTEGSKVLYFSVSNENDAETVDVIHRPRKHLRTLNIVTNFNDTAVKGRDTIGNILTRYGVSKVVKLKKDSAQTEKKSEDPKPKLKETVKPAAETKTISPEMETGKKQQTQMKLEL